MEKRGTCSANLGPLGYVWDQLPVTLRAQWRDHVGLDLGGVLGFEYAIGLRGIGHVLAVDPERPVSETCVKTHIRRRGLPVIRPIAGCGFVERGKVISPLCRLLRWGDIYLGRDLSVGLRPLAREEVK